MNYEGTLYRLDEKPFGRTWTEWTLEWWMWLLSIPRGSHPAEDMTGKDAYKRQVNPNVMFLAGTRAGSAVRKISIHSGKAIFIPVINFTTSFFEDPSLKTDSDLITRAKSDIDDIEKKQVTINGENILDTEIHRVDSPPFDISYPEHNLFELPSGMTRAASDGYWLFLRPLPEGQHKIHVSGSCSSGRTSISVTYDVTVKD